MITSNTNMDYSSMSDDRLALMFGEYIKHSRVEKNMSQEELAMATGLSRPAISLMERGKSMSLNSIIKVLRALDRLDIFDVVGMTQTMLDFMTIAKLINCRKLEAIIWHVRKTVSSWCDFAAQARVDDNLAQAIQESLLNGVEDD